jgi:hypothetical protein
MAKYSVSSRDSEIRLRIALASSVARAPAAEYFRGVIHVTHYYSLLMQFGRGYSRPNAGESAGSIQFEDVIGEILNHLATGPDDELDGQGGADHSPDSPDLAIWQGRRLIAVVRRGHDGRPIVTRFEV